jgi:CBS domain-containing protein
LAWKKDILAKSLSFSVKKMSGILLVRDVMTKSVKTVGVNASVKEAVQKMNKFRIGSIIVLDNEKNKIQGILTERDILRLVETYPDPLDSKVREVMTHQVVTIESSANIEEAAELMTKRQVKTLPVIDDNKLVGIVTSSDIIKANPTLVRTLLDINRAKPTM